MRRETLLGGTFCIAAIALMAGVISTSGTLTAQRPGEAYTTAGCGEFNGKLCKTVKTTACVGSACTEETSYYYYSTSVD